MTTDATYFASPALAPARHLQRAGQWDAALAALPDTADAALLRADILVDRHAWRQDDVIEALDAVTAIRDAHPPEASYLLAQLEYWRQLFREDTAALAGDPAETFASLVDDARFGGWADFWEGVVLEQLHEQADSAGAMYESALRKALARGDILLESYAVRHIGGQAFDKGDRELALRMFERSLDLRSSRAARAQIAAAQSVLISVLEPGERVTRLHALATATAEELDLSWLKEQLSEGDDRA